MIQAVAVFGFATFAFCTSAVAQVCDICDADVELSPAEAACFLEHADAYIADAQVAEPVLVNLGQCAAPVAAAEPDRGDADLFCKGDTCLEPCEGDDCPEAPGFVILSGAQVGCLVRTLRKLDAGDTGLFLYDFADCR